MKFQIIKTIEFNKERELNRINNNFEGELKTKLIQILELFCAEKFQECLDIVNSLTKDSDGIDEKEYIHPFITDNLWELGNGLVDKITKI